jgi:hypothetical protein
MFWSNLLLSFSGNYGSGISNLSKASSPALRPTLSHFSGYRKFLYQLLIDMDVKLTIYHNLVPRLIMCGTKPPQHAAEGVTINTLKTKRRLLYLKTQFVPRSKHFSSRL